MRPLSMQLFITAVLCFFCFPAFANSGAQCKRYTKLEDRLSSYSEKSIFADGGRVKIVISKQSYLHLGTRHVITNQELAELKQMIQQGKFKEFKEFITEHKSLFDSRKNGASLMNDPEELVQQIGSGKFEKLSVDNRGGRTYQIIDKDERSFKAILCEQDSCAGRNGHNHRKGDIISLYQQCGPGNIDFLVNFDKMIAMTESDFKQTSVAGLISEGKKCL